MNENIKKIWGRVFVKAYAPNSVRYEADADGQKAFRCIYINDEFVETAPLCATKKEAEMRLQELMYQRWLEWELDPRWHEIK